MLCFKRVIFLLYLQEYISFPFFGLLHFGARLNFARFVTHLHLTHHHDRVDFIFSFFVAHSMKIQFQSISTHTLARIEGLRSFIWVHFHGRIGLICFRGKAKFYVSLNYARVRDSKGMGVGLWVTGEPCCWFQAKTGFRDIFDCHECTWSKMLCTMH